MFSYFVVGGATAGLAVAGKNFVLPILSTLSASKDVMAAANVEIDLSQLEEGSSMTVKWRGKPLFVRHRTQEEIDKAVNVNLAELPDPEPDENRYRGPPNYLILLGICTHLGCVPINGEGNYGGWFCPCHGSHYDTSGRIRQGPAPKNLEVPPYYFVDESRVIVGTTGD